MPERLTFIVGRELHRRIRLRAVMEGRSLADIGRELFEAWLRGGAVAAEQADGRTATTMRPETPAQEGAGQ